MTTPTGRGILVFVFSSLSNLGVAIWPGRDFVPNNNKSKSTPEAVRTVERGTHVLLHLLCSATTPHLYLPLRRDLPSSHPALSHPSYSTSTVTRIIRSDLLASFADDADIELKTAVQESSAFIWCVGAPGSDFPSHSLVDYVSLAYTLTLSAARALSKSVTSPQSKTFVYCSGAFVARCEDASQAWIKTEWVTRDVKGRTETDLHKLSTSSGMRGGLYGQQGSCSRARQGSRIGCWIRCSWAGSRLGWTCLRQVNARWP